MKVWFVLVLISVAFAEPLQYANEDVSDGLLSLLEILAKHGYPGEKHSVTTEDGYILGIYRIPYGKKCGADQTRKSPVLLQHGLFSNGIDYIIGGEEMGLGYLLAEECYDVWLGNSRGNFESQNHLNYTRNQTEFWQFSWHEMGQYDLPAVISHILETTGAESLHYVGHSQGTTEFFVYSALYPEDSAKKVTSMHALAPVAFMENMTSPVLRWAANNLNSIEEILDVVGLGEFVPQLNATEQLSAICNEQHPDLEKLCGNLLFIICGFDSEQFNVTLLPDIAGHDPAGASTRQLIHYGQEILSAKFRWYDYGEFGNIVKYGQEQPPDYEIEKITTPLYLWYGENDWLASVYDVERFAAVVPSAVLKKVPFPAFNHVDFLWANDVVSLLYTPLIEVLNSY